MCDSEIPLADATRLPRLAVLDTQVVLDWLVFRDPSTVPLAHSIESGCLRWLATPAMRNELEHVLDRGVGVAWQPDRAAIAQAFERLALRVEPRLPSGPPVHCRDPDDQMFIDLALAVGARWLFTRDRALLHLARRARARGLLVLRPADWTPPAAPTATPARFAAG